MNFHFRQDWRALKRGRPGRRFQARYQRARQERKKCGLGQRITLMVVALICLTIGAVFAVFPGPAIPFFFIAGALLASESRVIARFMDWCEVRVRTILAWAKRRWRNWPMAGRVAVIVAGTLFSAGAAYFSYRWFIA